MTVVEELSEYEMGLLERWVASVTLRNMGERSVVALLTLTNGFELVGTAHCKDPALFNQDIGELYALKDALQKLAPFDTFHYDEQHQQ